MITQQRREKAPRASLYGEDANRRGLIAVQIDTFCTWAGFNMIVPLISVHYVDQLGWAAAGIGLLLGMRQLAQQGTGLLGGVFADRIGPKPLICAGLLVRAIGFATMAFADSFPLLMASLLLAAFGGALFDSPKAAAIAALTTPETRTRVYSLNAVFSNIGAAVGIQIGALLLGYNFALVALGGALFFLLTFTSTLILLPAVRVSTNGADSFAGIRLVFHDRAFINYTLLLIGFWFLWVQSTLSIPLAATGIAGTVSAVSWVYLLSSGMNILLQYPLLRLVERWLRPQATLVLGVSLMGAGLGSVALANSLIALLASVALLATGTMLAVPSQQTVSANLADRSALGSYFGVNSLSLAVGGGLGNVSAGALYDLAQQNHIPALPWATFAAVGLATAVGLRLMFTALAARRAQQTQSTIALAPDAPQPGE